MERIHLLLVVLLGVMPQVWCQTVEITDVDVRLTGGSDTYIEAETHTFVFDVDITVGTGGNGADDAAVDRWGLEVTIYDNGGTTAQSTKTLTRENGGLTPAQADLIIAKGSTGTIAGVEYEVDTFTFDDNARCPLETAWYTLQVKVLPGDKTPATSYSLTGVGGDTTEDLDDPEPPELPCRGIVVNLVPHIVSGFPIIENTDHALTVDVIVTNDANSRSISTADGTPLWDLKFTLEKDGEEIEVGTVTVDDDEQNLASGGSITFDDVAVTFDLTDTDPTTCNEIDELCVKLQEDSTIEPSEFTFRGGNPKKCITINNEHCNGLLITDIAVGLTTSERFCQGYEYQDGGPNDAAVDNQVLLTMTVYLDENSAPLVVGRVGDDDGEDIWEVNVFATSEADCSNAKDGVKATTAVFITNTGTTPAVFNDMDPGVHNAFPQIQADFDLRNYGCPQVKYICVQLKRNDVEADNTDFTYEFPNPGVSSVGVNSGGFDDSDLNTDPPSSQWGVTEIQCQGVELQGSSLTLDSDYQNLGEYTRLHRIDFEATFAESNADCLVQGDDLWELQAFLTRKADTTMNAIHDNWKYPYVANTNVTLIPGREDQDINKEGDEIAFADSRIDFDLSNLDCQEGPFYLCVWLRKNPDANKDFTLEDADAETKYVVCSAEINCVGVDLQETKLSEAQTPSNNYFPLRQGLDNIKYLIDVKVESDELAGSIIPNPETPFNDAATSPYDLWDLDVFLSDDDLGSSQVSPVTALDDRFEIELEDLELQAGEAATFESVEVQLDLTDVQCYEFEYLCVTVKHGARHDQGGLDPATPNTDGFSRRAPTLEGISTDQTTGTADTDDAEFNDVDPDDTFYNFPSPRPMSDITDCIPVECRGVEITDISCDIESDQPTGTTSGVLTGDIQEGDVGIFHLSLEIDTDGNAGGVNGRDLWKLTVFLSPDEDGNTVTIGSPVNQVSPGDVNDKDADPPSDRVIDWEDTDVIPGETLHLDVWTDDDNPLELNYPCEDIRYLCVKFEKGYESLTDQEVVDGLAGRIEAGNGGDNDFTLTPNPFISCKVLDSCGGVILDAVTLALNPDSPNDAVIEKQDSTTLTGVNQLQVDVSLEFNEESANFANEEDFWDIYLFIAENDVGTEGEVAAKNGVFEHLDGPVIGYGEEDVADRTQEIFLDNGDPIDPEFDLTGVTCKDGDTNDGYLYLCVRVTKSDDASVDFSLTPEQRTTCIKIDCEGVIFDTPENLLIEPSDASILEVTQSNELEISVEFPIENNGADVSNNYPSDLWRLIIFLTDHEDGSGQRIAEFEPELREAERSDGVSSSSPLRFNDKDVVLSMYNKLCPAGDLYICAELKERDDAEPDCSIDTSEAVICQEIACSGAEFTTIAVDLPNDACLVEHEENDVSFDFEADTRDGTASVSGTNLWLLTVYGSVDPMGDGILRFGETLAVIDESTSLTAGDPFELDALANLNLADFVCPEDQLYLCVELERNTENAEPLFSLTTSPTPFRVCEEIDCKGVKINGLQFTGLPPDALIERAGPSTLTSDLRITTDRDYAGIQGENLWSITGELRDSEGEVYLSVPADLTQAQRNQGLSPGQTTTFNDISVTFDLDRNVPCPQDGFFQFCIIIDKGDRVLLNPDFSIDEDSLTEVCRSLSCRGVCVEASTATAVGGEPLQEGVNEHEVWIDAVFYSDPEFAGIIESDARDLWKVNVFASTAGDGQTRWAETEGVLDTNNANYPLPAGGELHLSNIYAKLDFNGELNSDYLTCSDVQYICVELLRGDDPNPDFSLFGCPSTRLVTCTHFDCQGVLIEDVELQLHESNGPLKENTETYDVIFDLVLTPNDQTSILDVAGGDNYWAVELFGSNVDAAEDPSAERNAETVVIIPSSELNNGISRPGPGITNPDTTLAGLTASVDLTNEYCGDLRYLCARVYRGSGATPPFTLNGVPNDYALIGCTRVDCEGVDVIDAEFQNLEPLIIAEGNPSWLFEYDVTFDTHEDGGGVFGSNLWKLATFLAVTSSGTGTLDLDGEPPADVIYPYLTGGAESQTLVPGESLGFQNVQGTFDTRGFTCPTSAVYFCVRLEKDDERSSSEFTLNSSPGDRQVCREIDCRGVEITDMDFSSDRTIITEREPDQSFELDIIATTSGNSGSISGENLWCINVFFNSESDGTGDDYGTTVQPELDQANANRPVNAGNELRLNNVVVDVSAANVLCGNDDMYLCVSLKKADEPEPNFSLNPGVTTVCKEITCNPVIITSAKCVVNSPLYLLENIDNTLNLEIQLISASLSAEIVGENLWSLDHVFTRDDQGNTVAASNYEILTQSQRDRDLHASNSLILSDINAHLDLRGDGVTCDDIEYLCIDFGKNALASPDYTLDFQGDITPPWCKEIACKGVEVTGIELNVDTLSVDERTADQNILFDVTVNTDPGAAGVSGDNLWTIKTGFTDYYYNPVPGSIHQTVELGQDDRSVIAGIPLEFSNLLAEDVKLSHVICPEHGLFFCVYLEKNPATTNDFTLTGVDENALHACEEIKCEGVQITDTSIQIDSGDEISENAPSATHIINFQFEATSAINTAIVSGSNLWQVNVFGSRNDDGSGPRYLEDTLSLSDGQRNQDLNNGGQILPFTNLAATLDLRGVRCVDFQYFCAEIARSPSATEEYSLQGIDNNGDRDDDVLIACQAMKCVGAYITTFDATPDNPIILLENTDSQVFTLDAFLESDVNQESVNGANLWAMKAFFNPSGDCQGLDENGHQIRIAESNVQIFGGEDDQALLAGGSINFNDLRIEFDYEGTCEPLDPATYLCLEVIRSPTATPAFTLLGNTLKGVHAECRGVEVIDTTIIDASWTPSVFVERSGGSRKRQTDTLVFNLDVLVETNINAAGVEGSDLWQVGVYLSGDKNCQTWDNDTFEFAPLSSTEENQNLSPGGPLSFDINGVQIPVEGILCENARYVCARIWTGENPSNDFTLIGIPDESSLVGSWPLDCRGVRVVDSHLEISAGLPLISGEPNHQIVFSFTINTDENGAGVDGTDLFTLYVYGNDQHDGFGQIPNDGRAAYILPITQEVLVTPGVPNSFDFLPARLNLQGVSCAEVPYVCVQIYKGALPDPNFTLQPDDPLDPVFTDCTEVPCTGVVIDELELEFSSGLPLLEDAAAHRLDFFIKPTASAYGGDAVGTGLWAADIFISANADGSGPRHALTPVNIVNPDEDLYRGTSIDILANVVLDLSGVVCVNVQYICVDLHRGPDPQPDFSLEGTPRICQGFSCKGVDFINPGLYIPDDINLRMLTPNTHVEFNAWVYAAANSATVSGSNLFKVTVFASPNSDGSGIRYGEAYADVSSSSDVGIVAGQRSSLNEVEAYLDLTGVYCSNLRYLCVEIWRSDFANPYFQIDNPTSPHDLRVCQPISCNGVWISSVVPEVQLGAPLIENRNNRNTWIDIHVTPSPYSASIIGDNLWKASCFANSEPDGSGIRYSLQNAILQPSELNKDFIHSYDDSDYLNLENAVVLMDYSGRRCSEIQYICCTIGENEAASPDFVLQGEHGYDSLLTGCSLIECLGVGVTSTRLTLDDLQILKGDNSHTFVGEVDISIWHESRAIQEDNTWALHAYVVDNDGNEVSRAPVNLIQEQQDRAVIPGSDITFEDLRFEVDLSNLECYQIAYVCVRVGTQTGVDFTLSGVTESGDRSDDALVGCSPHLQCGDFDVDIEVTDVGERHIEIRWNEGAGDFDHYVISYAPEEQIVESPLSIPRHLREPLRFDGLTPGQEYTFNLYLYKGSTIKAGPITEVERTRPATVDVTINRQTNSELHVQWSEADGVYDTYIVELYPQGTPPTPIYVDALSPREQIFSGLREARVYTVTVYTVVGGRNGYRSLPGYASETTRPAPPYLELDDTSPGTTHVDLSWIAPNGYLVAGYKLTSEPDDQGTNLPIEFGPDLDSFRVTGLAPGRQYTFHLQAFAEVDGQNIYSLTDSVQARTYPEPVHEVEITEATTTSITFEWEEPPGDKDSYLISYPEQIGEPIRISALLPQRFTASGLPLATHQEFTIVTVSGGLESAPYKFVAATRPNRPGPVRPTEVDTDTITIEWDPAQGPRDGYEVSYSPYHPNYQPPSPYFTTDEEFTLTGLHPHTTIDFEVRTVSEGAKSDEVTWRQRTYPDLPGPVENFHVVPSSATSVVLSFSQPEYPNGLITAYIVKYEGSKPGVLGIDSGLQTITALPNDHDFEEELFGLRSGYTYTFEIQAANSEGSGSPVTYAGVTLVPGLPILLITDPQELNKYFRRISASAYTIQKVPVYEEFFSDANGEIIGYAVLVVQDHPNANLSTPRFPPSYQQVKRNYDIWPVYQTSDIFTIEDFYYRKKRQAEGYLSYVLYEVGTENNCADKPGYCNGPLRPLTTYRVCVRAYTEAGYAETPWSQPITTKADQWWFAYAAIPFLIIVLVLAIILALFACIAGEKKVDRRRKYTDYQHDDLLNDYGAQVYNENANANTVYMISNTADSPIPGPGTLQTGKLNPTHVLGTRPILINKFQEHVTSMAEKNAIKFVEEYENLRPIGDDLARLIGGLPENKDKNRFSNILPYDYNRVQLSGDTYINASFIGGFNSRHEYIATQGPLPNSIEDFWHMVWENNCPTVVMMGRCIEDGHVKCEQYWPESDKTVTYGNLSITMVTEKVGDEWTVRDFTVQSGAEIRAVRQFNFTAWPNHGVPEQTDGVVRFVSTVRAEAPQHSGPMVIHCGAGIGRTGIFLALDILMQGLVYDETTVDVYGSVSSLRKQRCCMVQTVHQYIFLHKAMLDILQGKATGYNWLLRTRKGSVGSRDSDQLTSDTL